MEVSWLACGSIYDGKRISILGFGRSGRAVADFFLPRGNEITVYEKSVDRDVREQYFSRGVQFCEGELPSELSGDILVRSPVIRPDILPIRRALLRGASLTSEIELLTELCPATVIGVTGSDGKTTTTALIAALLESTGRRVLCGGNNGTPLLPRVTQMQTSDFVVLELSSFQLMTLRKSPSTAVITNITPNHLDWHTDMAEYIAAKTHILAGATRLVINGKCPTCATLGDTIAKAPTVIRFGEKEAKAPCIFLQDGRAVLTEKDGTRVFDCREFRLPGGHNKENLLAAIAAAAPYIKEASVPPVLGAFRGVRHRLQYVDTVSGVTYYNSSIDTSPTRTAAALAALGGSPLVIAGGRGKGISLAPLADALAAYARAVFLYGETAGEIEKEIGSRVPVRVFSLFADAFHAAAETAMSGDTVLLSPGCTAFGEFRDFEERGAVFEGLVAALPRKG